MLFLKKNISIRGRWYLFIYLFIYYRWYSFFIIFLWYIKNSTQFNTYYSRYSLSIYLILAFLKFFTNVIVYCLLISFMFWKFDWQRQIFVCQAVLKSFWAIFYSFFIQIILIQTLLSLDIICLRFPQAKDMFKICLILDYFQPHDFSPSSFLKSMQNWINIKLNTILRRY